MDGSNIDLFQCSHDTRRTGQFAIDSGLALITPKTAFAANDTYFDDQLIAGYNLTYLRPGAVAGAAPPRRFMFGARS